MQCPNCGNTKIYKQGRKNGKQRYHCTGCGAYFTEGIPYKISTVNTSGIKCPNCGSSNIVGNGKLRKEYQKYLCKDCKTSFSDLTNSLFKIRQKCPYCGSSLNYSGKGKKGQIEYYCPSCKKSCSGDIVTGKPIKRYFFKEINDSIICPRCFSKKLRKAGIIRGRQKYECTECGRAFIPEATKKVHSPIEIQKVIDEILKGGDVNEIAKKYNYSNDRIRRLIKPYYEKEKITEKQKSLILTYGHYLKVPVEYIAEYIPCSRKMCKKVLEEYIADIRKTPKRVLKARSTKLGATLKNLSKIYCNSSVQKQ